MIALGAVPARIASRRTAVVVLDPRVKGKARILPAAVSPARGWRKSMIFPVS